MYYGKNTLKSSTGNIGSSTVSRVLQCITMRFLYYYIIILFNVLQYNTIHSKTPDFHISDLNVIQCATKKMEDNEDNLRNNSIQARLTNDEILEINLFCKNTGMKRSNFLRDAIKEKLQNDNPKYLTKRKKELQEELERIKKQEKFFEQKTQESTNFTKAEIQFLIESKEKIEKNPNFLDGCINKFINDFGKPYKISRNDFYKLMDEVENQSQEEKIIQEMPQ